jgi:hypothetical protein
MKKVLHHYGDEFNTQSSNIIIPYLKSFYNFESVVDVGCGIGTWLAACKEIGVEDLLGIDGEHVLGLNQFLLPKSVFFEYNLDNQIDKLKLSKKYGLSICLEVVEHLQPNIAEKIVKFLVSSSDVILFSAAVPGQTGENHFNEQFPDYWSDIFTKHNYVFLDPFREKFWKNNEVEWWYRQNLFLVVNKEVINKFKGVKEWTGNVYIIPELLKRYTSRLKTANVDLSNQPTKRDWISRVKGKLLNLLK